MTRCWGHVPDILSDHGEGSRLCGGWERFSRFSCGWVGGSVYWEGHPGIVFEWSEREEKDDLYHTDNNAMVCNE